MSKLSEIERLRRDNLALKEAEAKTYYRVRQLERELKQINQEKDSAENVREKIYRLAAQSPSPPKWLSVPKKHDSSSGVPMTMWSDWHWGEIVNRAEVGGANAFNRTIAKQRLAYLVDQTIDLALRHMTKPRYPGIVVCLAGDFYTGTIHEDLRETNEGFIFQIIAELQDNMVAALERMADAFGRVFVPCVVGNHGRATLRPRNKGHVYTNYEWNVYCQLEKYFHRDNRIQFLIPGETDAYFSVLGHRFLLTHGDTLGVRGGDGIIGALGPITRGAIKVGRSEAQIGRDFDTLLMGHYHIYVPRGDASAALVNGSLIGYNEHARLALRVPYARPSQALWFVHERHGFTAQWPIYLDTQPRKAKASEWLSWRK
jgi:predicted phosphodiesterase